MKKFVTAAALLLAILAPASFAAQKIAVVDMNVVIEQHPQREQVTQQLEAQFSERVAAVQAMQTKLRGLMEKQQRDGALMNEKQKTDMAREMESLNNDLQLKGRALEEDMQRVQGEQQQKLLLQVRDAIDSVASKGGYDLILEARAVLYVGDKIDISNKIVDAISTK